jgi:hypothetical protein
MEIFKKLTEEEKLCRDLLYSEYDITLGDKRLNNIAALTYNIKSCDNIFIYIELDKYNKSDELKPYLYYNNSNTSSGIINGAFAKIPHTLSLNNNCTVNDGYLDNVSYFQPPIDKIAKIKLKFRYHNGMLVDFNNFNISLSLEINQLRNEMNNYEVRTPYKI